MRAKRLTIALVSILSVGIVSGSYAGFFDGPLTRGAQAEQKPVAKTSSQPGMPSPAATQFQAAEGGAPTGAAAGHNLQGHLPPVVDAQPGAAGRLVVVSDRAAATESTLPRVEQTGSRQGDLRDGAPVDSVAGSAHTLLAENTMASTVNQVGAATDGLSADQRLARVEQQLNNLVRMNLPQQMSDMQMQLQQLSGQLQVQEHDIKLLNQQQRSFYQDLDQRIKKMSGTDDGNDKPSASPSGKKAAVEDDKNTPSARVAVSNIELKDSSAYKKALDQVIKRQYDKALTSLSQYVKDYPNGAYVDKAHFWLGEIYYLKKSYSLSLAQFNAVVKDSPRSPRVSDAKLKIALIHLQSGQSAKAKQELTAVKNQYPNSTAAQLAIIQLKQLDL